MTTVGHYIDGSRIDPSSRLLARHNPATAEMIGQVLVADEPLVRQAVESAADAFRPWRCLEPARRGAILRTFSEKVKADA